MSVRKARGVSMRREERRGEGSRGDEASYILESDAVRPGQGGVGEVSRDDADASEQMHETSGRRADVRAGGDVQGRIGHLSIYPAA